MVSMETIVARSTKQGRYPPYRWGLDRVSVLRGTIRLHRNHFDSFLSIDSLSAINKSVLDPQGSEDPEGAKIGLFFSDEIHSSQLSKLNRRFGLDGIEEELRKLFKRIAKNVFSSTLEEGCRKKQK